MDSLSSFDLTVREAQNRLRSGSLSVEDLCSKINVRMKKTKGLNIHVTTASENYLLEQSKQSQRRIHEGIARPLEGIPIGFKDNFCSKDMPTTCCSRSLSGFVPSYNSTLIQRCLDNGALLTGKLNMDEFALGGCNLNSYFGPCVNPWTLSTLSTQSPVSSGLTDKDFYVSGGSSGGSGAAVAAGTCLAAFGSDTGGSVRIPASYCGVVGLKPTYGLLSRHGVVPFANSLDCPGILTRTVEDCAIILNVVSGPDCEDSTTIHSQRANIHLDSDLDMKELHIGIPKEYHVPGMSQEVVALWQDMGDLLEKAGAKVSTVSLPKTKEARECYNVISCCELADTFSRFDKETLGLIRGNTESVLENSYGKCQPDLGKEVQQRVQQGLGYLKESNSETEKHYMKAKQIRRQICDEFKDLFDGGVDMLLTPTTISEAPLKSWCLLPENQELLSTMDPLLETANLAGLPAISIPLRLSRSGLPLSLQLIGQAFGESNLLSVAHWLEQTANCTYLSPNV